MEEACQGGDVRKRVEASMKLREHFCKRTSEMVVPLMRYLNTLIPGPEEVRRANEREKEKEKSSSSSRSSIYGVFGGSHHGNGKVRSSTAASRSTSTSSSTTTSASTSLRLKPFSTTAFLSSLKQYGSPLPFKSSSKRTEFYERWLRTPAFGVWLAMQEERVGEVLRGRGGG
jgi:hypothetical protein